MCIVLTTLVSLKISIVIIMSWEVYIIIGIKVDRKRTLMAPSNSEEDTNGSLQSHIYFIFGG